MNIYSLRILFLTKEKGLYGDYGDYGDVDTGGDEPVVAENPDHHIVSGLIASVQFVADMLTALGVSAKHVEVVDNNDIDREVAQYKPTHVFLDALWVVPEKFVILTKLHPSVKWIVRLHSEIPFLAQEGVAMQWIFDYVRMPQPVFIAANDRQTARGLEHMLGTKVLYMPNYYPVSDDFNKRKFVLGDTLDVGCFGAIRPLKNQLIQAVASIELADKLELKLRFHVNSARVEGMNALTILKNLRALFEKKDPTQYTLVEHGWLGRKEFLKLISSMNLSLQVSFSETFNIVTADAVDQGVPVVVSPAISWVTRENQVDCLDVPGIVEQSEVALEDGTKGLQNFNKLRLFRYGKKSAKIWLDTLEYFDWTK
jgi:glycosyltransferase involved in cell wall biosynthesis